MQIDYLFYKNQANSYTGYITYSSANSEKPLKNIRLICFRNSYSSITYNNFDFSNKIIYNDFYSTKIVSKSYGIVNQSIYYLVEAVLVGFNIYFFRWLFKIDNNIFR